MADPGWSGRREVVTLPGAQKGPPQSVGAGDKQRSLADELTEMQSRDYFTLLGLKRDAGASEVRRSFLRLAKKWHPNVHALASAEDRAAVAEIFILIKRAHDTLADSNRAAAYRARLPKEKEAEAPTKATAAAKKTPPTGTPVKPTRAVAKTPAAVAEPTAAEKEAAEVEHEIHVGINLLVAYDFRLARARFQKTLERSPGNPRLRALLTVTQGLEQQVSGQLDRAAKFYQEALQLDPQCQEAKAGLQQLADHKADKKAKKKGLFRRFFYDE